MAINDFHLNTDHPTDKIIYRHSVSIPLAAFGFLDLTVPHSLGFTPLTVGNYSPSVTMSPLYSENTSPFDSFGFTLYDTAIFSDNSNVYVSVNNNTASAVTLYFNIYGYAPSTIPASTLVTFTANDSDPYLINTETNMTKLFIDNATAIIPDTGSVTIPHNLGYLPQVIAWSQNQTTGRTTNITTIIDVLNSATISNTNLIFRNNSFNNQRYFYRIYADAI